LEVFLCIREKETEDLKGICVHLIEKHLHLKPSYFGIA